MCVCVWGGCVGDTPFLYCPRIYSKATAMEVKLGGPYA